ncbi:DUF1929 domain-containing protein [Venturia nashicola]|nr:DUF1929 domain-containing protein [Venturia nashicola]
MAPGNAWHFPSTPEALANYDSMRSPVFPVDPRTPKVIVNTVTIFIGNQWSGSDTAGDLLSADSFLHWRTTDSSWTSVALAFDKLVGNNKYFRADIPLTNITAGTQIQYYFTLIYSNREPTFLGVAGNDSTGRISAIYLSEEATLPRPFTFNVATQNDQKVFTFSIDQRTERGEWSNVFSLPNVAAHASLLRTGKILMWGRRGDTKIESMNTRPAPGDPRKPATCRPWLLDLPITRNGITTADSKDAEVPFMPDGLAVNAILPKINGKPNANLFCSGHAFLPNGDLIVSGGHIEDGNGLDQSCIYEITPKPSKAASPSSFLIGLSAINKPFPSWLFRCAGTLDNNSLILRMQG